MRNTKKETTTDSLETPIMEKDLMKEPWIVQNPLITSSNNEEDNTVYSIWEENYQDLSDWCMDALQAPCVFLTGESVITEHSGPKIEDKNAPVNLLGVVDEDKGDIQVNKTVEETRDKMEGGKDIANIQMIHKYKIKDEKPKETIDLSDIWLTQQKSSIALRTDEWIKSVDNERIDGPLERENWDTINTFDTTASNSFDLLSYLCEDDIQSPDGSVSTDSISVFTANPIEQQCKTSRKYKNTEQKPETITSSTLSSTSAQQDDSMPSSSSSLSLLSSTLRKTRGSSKGSMKKIKKEPINEMPYVRSNRGKKRTIESDSDDRMSDCSYRESREKNNEASRKSRLNKKTKENEMMARAGQLEKDNRLLKMKVEELEKMVTSMRAAILRSALMKNNI